MGDANVYAQADRNKRQSRDDESRNTKILARRTLLFSALSMLMFADVQCAMAQNVPATDASASTQASSNQSGTPDAGNAKAAPDKKIKQLQTVTVTGILGSLDRTINAKRSETAIVDAISAEDVGKFPDTNIAESLQHITGVEITRDSNGEGQYVTVRGLPDNFTQVTLNGDSATTTTLGMRTFDFSLLSPDFIQTLKVYKSSRADLDEGGIGANVDMQTVTPFGIGKERALLTAQLQGDPGTSSNRNYPDITGLYSNVFDDGEFGLTVGFDWNKRFILNQGATLATDESPFYPVTINGKGPYLSYSEIGYGNDPAKIDTKTVYASLQGKLGSATIVTLTGLYAKRDKFDTTSDFGVVPIEPYNQPTVDGPGSNYTVDKNGVFTSLATPDVAWTYYNTTTDERSQLKNLRLNFDTELENWTLSESAQYSSSRDDLHWMRPLLINSAVDNQTPTPGATIYGGYEILPGVQIPSYIFDPALDMTNPNNWASQQFKDFTRSGTDTLKSLRADITRHFDDGVLDSIQFGAKIYRRSLTNGQKYWVFAQTPGSTADSFLTAVQYPGWTQNVLDAYDGPGNFPSNWFYINPNLWMNQYFGSEAGFQNAATLIDHPTDYWNLIERGREAYALANFKFDGSVPITGNVGVRYVDTKEEFIYNGIDLGQVQLPDCVLGTAGCENAILPPITQNVGRGGSHKFLPSLNVVAQIRDDMDVRLAISKTLSLPQLTNLIPSPQVNLYTSTISEGNTNLSPFTSLNYDLSWEWYFRPSSMLSIAVYDKQLSNFIGTGKTTQLIGTPPLQKNFIVTLPVNGGSAYVRGLEADYKQVLDFLPGAWSGFGFELNATYSKGQQDAAPQYGIAQGPFPGLSKKTYNASLFYEKYGFSGIITLNHRSRYLVDPDIWGYGTSQLYGATRNEVDAKVSYNFTNYLTGFVDVRNLLNKPIVYQQTLINGPSSGIYPGAWQDDGRRVMVGVSLQL